MTFNEVYLMGAVVAATLLYTISAFGSPYIKINPIGFILSAVFWPVGFPFGLYRFVKLSNERNN